ncbi:PHD finger protein rhinoceros [Amphibalanus amphitrite]|uniref:PHD finger protein rhinoceros n=1 Tax=Amphibalanus amphitrite TaxID=1232801 RepID=A0A6A4W4F5_AMPAM|nr:PHD finger protein rhinoceros [Amphibalanus amphitrite]
MSQRLKRLAGKPDDPGPMGKRKRRKLSGSEDADSQQPQLSAAGHGWTPKHLGDLKAYNKKAVEKPGELIRTDLISAMKLADSEYLSPDEYLEIADQWKQEWERGVQVPVNPDTLPHPRVSCVPGPPQRLHDFKLPKKLVRVTHDDSSPELYHMTNAPAKAEKMCRYDLDEQDSIWLGIFNGERARMGLPAVSDLELERAIEELERQCWNRLQTIVKTQECLSIEFDESVVCDVCRQPDSEEENEMVFCDKCNICVHQMCYGITSIPDGSWLCKTCALGIKPECVLCPNKGGAMKSTRSGHKWAHVSCALWIPEVSIGDVEKMEPVTKISNISARRWALLCVLCKQKVGACIQCSVKSCKTAYHVTCAFKHNLKMKPVEDESDDDEIKLKSYCPKHSKNEKLSGESDSDGEMRRADPDSEAQRRTRKQKLQQIEAEFYKHVDLRGAAASCGLPTEALDFIYNYWKLKRKSCNNKALLTPNTDEIDLRTEQQQQDLEKIKQFVHIRQNLEKVRNLCYMVTKRQKQCRNYFRLREQTFLQQEAVLRDSGTRLSAEERRAVLAANHVGSNVYDRHYSHAGASLYSQPLEQLLDLIRGKGGVPRSGPNGAVRRPGAADPYRRTYVNGAEQRRDRLATSSCTSESDGGSRSRERRSARSGSSTERERRRPVSGATAGTASQRPTKSDLFGDTSESDAAASVDKHRRTGPAQGAAAAGARQ